MIVPFDFPLQNNNEIVDGVVMHRYHYNNKSFLTGDSNWDLEDLRKNLMQCRKRLETGDYRNSRMMSFTELVAYEKWLVKRIEFVEKNHPVLKAKKTKVKPFAETLDLFAEVLNA